MNSKNEYLAQVVQQQAEVDQLLRAAPRQKSRLRSSGDRPVESQETTPYRITGWWRWKTVVVPPNMYVIQTRRGLEQPLRVGLGISFRYNPYTDGFLLVPAAVQTLLINANCICAERQGILVQAYVQWIIGRIEIAYRRLDFSDTEDPMRLVNVQLREQAEAAIKDKVSTMSIDQVLSDKHPIITELTTRLRSVAEGQDGDEGLGLKIVTVQIKEAVVSSTSLWENLQKPFRAERSKLARLAELQAQEEIKARELQNRQTGEQEQIRVEARIGQLRHEAGQEEFDRSHAEQVRRQQRAEEAARRALGEHNQTELARREAELQLQLKALELRQRQLEQEVATLRAEQQHDAVQQERQQQQVQARLALAELEQRAEHTRQTRELKLLEERRRIDNDLSANHLSAQLVAQLAEIARAMPQPRDLHQVTISNQAGDSVLSGLLQWLTAARQLLPEQPAPTTPPSVKQGQ